MFLRELQVENVRGIQSAVVRLDATTALIGENGCGATSLFRALELALGGDAETDVEVSAADFHRRPGDSRPAGRMRIALSFEERSAGEWSSPAHAPLDRALPSTGKGRRRLDLEATAELSSRGGPSTLAFRVPGVREAERERRLVAHVRHTNPLIHVSGDLISGASTDVREPAFRSADRARLEPEIRRLVERISSAADALLRGRTPDPEAVLQEGFDAARELFARRSQHVDPVAGGLTGSVLEILGQLPETPRRAARAIERDSPVAERLGVLLLTAAVLCRIPRGLEPGCEPIWAVESPEAHLHPMTLAAVARLLERIRWQKVISTQSEAFLARLPLRQIRRIVRDEGRVHVCGVRPRALSPEDLRRVAHHLRARRGVAIFARVWLLVEGESEYRIVPQLAQVLGIDLDVYGIACVEYAQCGLEPLLRTARELGVEWHVLTDGDSAGRAYAATVRRYAGPEEIGERLTILPGRDIEHCLWLNGYAEVLRNLAGFAPGYGKNVPPRRVIVQAVRRRSKPGLALAVIESAARRGPGAVPEPLVRTIETCLRLASHAPARPASAARSGRVGLPDLRGER
jgi:putative ATP-dependent endonuclease of OLD family